MDAHKANEIWKSLSRAMCEIYNKNASVLSFEELYRNAYNLVLHKHGDLLYNGVQEMVETHLHSVAKLVAMSSDDQLLSQMCKQWKAHQVTMVMVRDILMYVPQNKKVAIYELGLRAFRKIIARHDHVKERSRVLLLENIRGERLGRLIDQNCMKCALHMLADLGLESSSVYEEDFETYFLEGTQAFYRNESRLFLSQNSCPDYLKRVERRISEEMARVPNYLHSSTKPKLQLIMETELISTHAQALIESKTSGLGLLLEQSKDRMDDLKRMYELFFRVPSAMRLLQDALYEHVRAAGTSLLDDDTKVKQPVEFLRSLLALKNKYDAVVCCAFQGEKIAQKRLKDAFESFINLDTRCASCLVIYIDELMRSGFKGTTEGEMESELDKILAIFRYLHDKDIFGMLYKQHLAKRLLNHRSMSSEAERLMLAKLKGECGYQYTTKLEGMFSDIKFSRGTTEKYNACRKRPPHEYSPFKIACNIDVTMLTAGYWPLQCMSPCFLPDAAKAATELFEEFYLGEHSGRKLTWVTNCGSVELRATLSEDLRHELCVSTYQMCILVLFNTHHPDAGLPFEEIARATQIPKSELKRHLISICTPKHRILLKSTKGKGIAESSTF